MDVVGADVCGEQCPLVMGTGFSERFQDQGSSLRVQQVGRLGHATQFGHHAACIGLQKSVSRNVVFGIDGARVVAVESGAVTGESDEVGQCGLV